MGTVSFFVGFAAGALVAFIGYYLGRRDKRLEIEARQEFMGECRTCGRGGVR